MKKELKLYKKKIIFQAANPGAVLQDFIRWYSPRDWVEEDTLDEWGQPKG